MRQRLKQSMKAVLAILAGVLLTTGGVSWVEADKRQNNLWHHGCTFTTNSDTYANGFCAYGCSQMGHSQYRLVEVDEDSDPKIWHCSCRD